MNAGSRESSAPHIDPLVEYAMYCDGASRGNPGRASVGFIIIDPEGNEIVARGEVLGDNITNNVAEYESILRGIHAALEMGIRRLRVHMDSQLVVRQLLGQYKVRHAGLQSLHAAVREAAQGLDGFAIEHVPRAQNSQADALANEALDDLLSQ